MSSIDPGRADVVEYMAKASKALGNHLPAPKDVFAFGGSSAQLSDRLLELAIRGKKTATTSWPVPNPLYWGPGDTSVILNGKGEPSAVMRTLSFVQCKFKDVAEDFALAEAEGDYESYREGHKWYYGQQDNGHEFGDNSVVLCERFEVIYPLRTGSQLSVDES
ncbi:hypothetical protein JX265_011490 [Neoarthrinium moseri]|uniref:ASCH domain-containing protein n=1 Tax=Neoarthrinium moseri TaxID=1658444 RepID=A0A9P9WC03_9PEZI|nr:hypothetical protein JX266_005518 [Neoarthrinium moseri]KAI1856531.1 hypothetical protein JX265_011490 [Neoarthrinium moseri]